MSGLIDRAVSVFVAPRAAAAAPITVARRAPRIAVLGSAVAARGVGAAVALGLRRGAACVAVWDPATRVPSRASTASPGARRLAAWLGPQGFEAAPRGRLAWAALPPDAAHAAPAWERLAGRLDAPAVLVLAGPRAAVFDAALAAADGAVVVCPPDADLALTELALASLAVPAVAAPPLAPAARLAALAGLAGFPLPAPLAEAIRA